jgi:5'-3' exonuclease
MGIPSYFKHLLDRYPKLLTAAEERPADILLVDFNCLIYGCIRSPKLPPYTSATRVFWEAALLREVNDYVMKVWVAAGKPAQVFLAVDGVVPMAKMRQQRLRRFKSVWLASQERALGVRAPGQEVWDTNAITPGTEFMEKLLRSLCTLSPNWIVSGANEEGEGEQKVMAWVRAQAAGSLDGKRIHVYGLDADLILLCLLHCGVHAPAAVWNILREKQEFGAKVASVKPKEVEFLTLSINGLLDVLFPVGASRRQRLYDYICGMSLLGNDFLPHSLSVSIRDGGHDRLMHQLEGLWQDLKHLTEIVGGKVTVKRDTLLHIVESWAQMEDEDVARTFKKKYTMRGPPPRSDAERAMLPVQNLPLEWAAESALWHSDKGLYPSWCTRYYEDACQADIEKRSATYCSGLQWILDYYTGQRPVSRAWMYPWSHPPLWTDLAAFVRLQPHLPPPPVWRADERPVQPQEQLAIVLPLESWSLIRDPHLRSVKDRLKAFWPSQFTFESLGKRWLWECEPKIPLLTPARLRSTAL